MQSLGANSKPIAAAREVLELHLEQAKNFFSDKKVVGDSDFLFYKLSTGLSHTTVTDEDFRDIQSMTKTDSMLMNLHDMVTAIGSDVQFDQVTIDVDSFSKLVTHLGAESVLNSSLASSLKRGFKRDAVFKHISSVLSAEKEYISIYNNSLAFFNKTKNTLTLNAGNYQRVLKLVVDLLDIK